MATKAPEWPILAASARKSEHPHERVFDLRHGANTLLRHLEVSKGSRVPNPIIDHVKNVQDFLIDLLKSPPGRFWSQGHEALQAEIKALRQSMEERLHSLEIASKDPSFPDDRSWANIAAQGGAPPVASTRSGSTGIPPSELMEAQIIVKLGDPDDVARFRKMIPGDMLAKAEKARIQVCQAEAPPAGRCKIRREAEAARQHSARARRLWKDADIRTPTWGMVVHGVRIKSVDLTRPEGIIKALLTDNAPSEEVFSMVVEFTSPVPANTAIKYSVLWISEILTAVKYDRSARLRQCYNCQQYGHIGSEGRDARGTKVCQLRGHTLRVEQEMPGTREESAVNRGQGRLEGPWPLPLCSSPFPSNVLVDEDGIHKRTDNNTGQRLRG
ncbi:hypothetical protein BO94DRAFT_620341 [Aspergillus sclerotioniger CBS 115572]|uniref:CCHC-type domain-containing protein n=1 Tax=Aspergillus sclerotioniger CBS 115572 TaxID=1450535 RepID=A0A317XBQ0_9EURO|nr:hypothetical protein BO94DRAFT_620341 [Aspergillus sclerotioniger CBS 115572]PWY96006.1 hypothetical protein BO94DRAFT_620341 [Aspergillus sclerotioniger CBS 115572]